MKTDIKTVEEEGSVSPELRRPTYNELHDFAMEVWKTCGAEDDLNQTYFNRRGNKLFLPARVPRKFA